MARLPSSSVRSLLRRTLYSSPSAAVRPLCDATHSSTAHTLPRPSFDLLGSSSLPLLQCRRHHMVGFCGSGDFVRRFSSSSIQEEDEAALEEEAQRKAGWLLKSIFVVTAVFAGFQFFPYMGDNLLQQSISLLRVRDPWFKRTGASRLARYAVDDGRRMKIVEMGGAKELLNVLKADTDDKTRKEILNALVAVSKSDEAAGFLHQAGAISIINSLSNSSEFAEIEAHKTCLLEKLGKFES